MPCTSPGSKTKGHLVKEREEEQSAEDSCVFLASERLKEALQSTLQQQRGFELCESTYTRIFSSSKHYNPTQSVVDRIPGCGSTMKSEPAVNYIWTDCCIV